MSRIWSDTFGVQDTALKTPVISDAFLNTYIAGTEYNQTTGVDILLRKLDEHGDLIWQTSYTNSGAYRDQATDIALDDSGNVYLCGASYVFGNHYDLLVLKFDSTGTLLWNYTLNGSASQGDGASALFIDSGSVFVTGPMTNTGSYVDYCTIRLSAAGVLQWQSTYNFSNLADVPLNITVSDGNVFVSGGSQNSFSDWDYASIQLLSHNGASVDTSRTGGTGIGFDYAAEAVCDDAGNYYITGTFQNNGNKDFRTIKFDAGLNVLWSESFDWDGEDDEAFSLTLDPFGNVYVAGASRDSSNAQFTIVKYDSTGTQQWIHRSGGLHYDKAARITCDDLGNVYATGERHNGFHADFYTLALDSSGTELWYKLFNGASNGNDRANMILVKDDYILVSGTSVINGTEQYITIAYGTYRLDLPPDTGSATNDSPNYFYPQLGQILNDTSGTAEVEYYSLHHGPALFLKDEELSFVWAKTDTSASTQDTLQRIDQVIFNSSERRLYEYSESESYLNYYLPHCGSGITNVHGYKWLSIPDVYRDVNLYYTFNRAGLKQMFVSKPGTKPTIELKYVGADTLIIDTSDGSLEIKGAIGSFKFARPYAYELDAQGNIIPGTLFYPIYSHTSGGIILIDNISYNVGNALVVVMERKAQAPPPPTSTDNLFWSTMFGSLLSDESYSIDVASDNTSVVAGSTAGNNFPTLIGANSPIQPSMGGSDCFVTYFDNQAIALFHTFFGGSDFDAVYKVLFDGSKNIHLVGITHSNDFSSVSSNGLNFTGFQGGNTDGFYVKMNGSGTSGTLGTILIDSYVGGSGEDNLTGICLVPNNYFIMVGYTNNDSGLPLTSLQNATSNYYQDSYGGGDRDGLLIEFNSSGSISWCTLFGGDGDDLITDIRINAQNKPVIAGLTNTDSYDSGNPCEAPATSGFPQCPPDPIIFPNGYFQTTNNGNYDAFVAQFDSYSNRGLNWSTFVGGSGDEAFTNIANKTFGFPKISLGYSADEASYEDIIIAGTTSSNGFFSQYQSAEPDAFNQNFNGGIADGFILQFHLREPVWSTYYGSNGDEDGITALDFSDGILSICGSAVGSTNYLACQSNAQGGFPICNLSGSNYIENYLSVGTGLSAMKTAIALFSNTRLLWSTRYNTNSGSSKFSGIRKNENALFLTGYNYNNNYTFQDFNPSSTSDHFQNYSVGQVDGTIVRFDVEETILATLPNNEITISNKTSIYPNPSGDLVYIRSNREVKDLVILDPLGKSHLIKAFVDMDEAINIQHLADGLYFIKYKSGNKTYTTKFIKQ